MPATWPGTLPQTMQISGYQETIPDGRLKSQTDTGPGKMRPRSSALGRPVVGTMFMDSDQLDTLQSFVASDLGGGTLPFDFPAVHGAGPWLVRFRDSLPSWSYLGGDTWQVALAIEILP